MFASRIVQAGSDLAVCVVNLLDCYNIFRLFNDSFFLDKGAIGEFAKEKLETLLRDILNKKGNKNDLQKRIDMIGDLFLKNRFQAQLLLRQ